MSSPLFLFSRFQRLKNTSCLLGQNSISCFFGTTQVQIASDVGQANVEVTEEQLLLMHRAITYRNYTHLYMRFFGCKSRLRRS
ncbi:unnamed protein product [Lactuca virosa]|uniref:Uncharacterized protein n=1 Tax=Lactuca virosa TaxID=75947 RepID=A0AAU9M0U6_9ASTR|nr:unnamed protein product [Lactuca virosa]